MKSFEEIKEGLGQANEKLRNVNPDELDEKLLASVVDNLIDLVTSLTERVNLLSERVEVLSAKVQIESQEQ